MRLKNQYCNKPQELEVEDEDIANNTWVQHIYTSNMHSLAFTVGAIVLVNHLNHDKSCLNKL